MRFDFPFRAASKNYSDLENNVPAPYLRGTFKINERFEKIQILISGLGFYDLFLNGEKITKGILAPYISNPEKEIFFDVYDVTNKVLRGTNALGVILGNGFYNAWDGFVWEFDKASYRGAPCAAFAVIADGKVIYSSANEVKTMPSPLLKDGLREGEFYDARLEIKGWCLPEFNCENWENALFATVPAGKRMLCEAEPICETARLKAVKIFKSKKGVIYDFGVNTAGVPALKINGEKGQKITLTVGEMLIGGELCCDNISCYARRSLIKGDIQTVTYICNGEKDETFSPSFSYYGGQYVLVSGASDGQLNEETVTFSQQNSAVLQTARFSSSSELVNKIFDCSVRSDFSNFYYFPTDCPHREKNGWTGDAYLSAEQFSLIMGAEKSLKVWLRSIRAMQKEDGSIPGVVPTAGWGYEWANGPSWDAVLTALPYYLYKYNGDETVLRDNADAIYKYLGYLTSLRQSDGLIYYGLGDWCQIGAPCESDPATPAVYVSTASAIDICEKAQKIFEILGQTERAANAETLKNSLRQAYRNNLIDWKFGTQPLCRVKCRTQTAQAMAIEAGVFDQSEKSRAVYKLKEMIYGVENRLQTGVFGTKAVLNVLSEAGEDDLAYEIAVSPDRASYGALAARGATTLWEFIHTFKKPSDYDDREVSVGLIKSMNHHFWGFVSAWFITRLTGLNVNENLNDITNITVKPAFVGELNYAQAEYQGKGGNAFAKWERVDGGVRLVCKLSGKLHGKLIVPAGYECEQDETLHSGENVFILKVKK